MAATMTREKLRAEIEGVVKEHLGATREELSKENRESVDKFLKNVETKISRQMGLLPGGGAEKEFSLKNRSHPYIQRHGHRLSNDPITLAGGRKTEAKGAGIRYARLHRAAIQARRANVEIREVLKSWGDDWMIKDLDEQAEKARSFGSVTKAQGADIFTTGGALVPEDYADEFVELLRPMVVVRAAGATQVPLRNGNMTFRRRLTSAGLSYAAESATVAATQGTYGQIRLNAMTLRGSVAIANELLEMEDADADIIVRNDLLLTLSERSDVAFLRGDGADNTPTGLRFLAAAGQILAASAGTSTDNIVTDLTGIMSRLATNNVPMDNLAWFMNPRTRIAIQFARDVGGGFLFGAEMAGGTLMGAPFFETTQLPNNLGGGSNEAELMLVRMPNVWIGDQTMARIESFPGGSYNDGVQMQSGISNNETVISIQAAHDIDVTHGEIIAGLSDVQY